MTEFEGVAATLGQALTKRGYIAATPVQKAVLAPALRNRDMLVSAQTGSGKTVAFGVVLAPLLVDEAGRAGSAEAPLALVVAPTRELALQVRRELEWLYEMTGAVVTSCVGGMDMRDERRALERGAHIVVGTPGRLRDHVTRGSLEMARLRAVVLDEADEMLDLGFREDLEFLLDAAPAERRTLLFSATVPRAIATLAQRYQRDAVRVSTAAEEKQHLDIEYRALTVASHDQEHAIINMLRYVEAKSTLIFCATRASVNHMTSRFGNRGFSVVALSGELSQNERSHALQAMRDGRARVCIATDVAARGIDLPDLDLVIHADIPKTPEALLHRSGRTGRAGRKGMSVLIVPFSARKRTERLLLSANVKAAWATPPSVDDVIRRDNERILADPALSLAISDDEQDVVRGLLARHGPEQVAAAFARLYRAGRSAPEELSQRPPEPEKPRQRNDFTNGVWFRLSVGRRQSAEPRWLLPMLCGAGNISKREIGAIRIEESESFVELMPACVEQFLQAVGPAAVLEKGITISRIDGPPAAGAQRGERPRAEKPVNPYANKRPYKGKGPQATGAPKRKFADAPATQDAREARTDAKPREKFAESAAGGPHRRDAKRSSLAKRRK